MDPLPSNKPLEQQQQPTNNNKPSDPPPKSLDQHKSLPHTPKSPYVTDAVKAPSAVELLQRLRGLDPWQKNKGILFLIYQKVRKKIRIIIIIPDDIQKNVNRIYLGVWTLK